MIVVVNGSGWCGYDGDGGEREEEDRVVEEGGDGLNSL